MVFQIVTRLDILERQQSLKLSAYKCLSVDIKVQYSDSNQIIKSYIVAMIYFMQKHILYKNAAK